MNIINILFDDRYGGPPKRVITVANELIASGIETVVCLPDRGGNVASMAASAGLKVLRVNICRIPRLSSLYQISKWIVLLARDINAFLIIFRQNSPDIVHVNGAFFVAPAIAAKLSGVPLIWHLNDTILPKMPALLFGRIVSLLANRIVTAADAVAMHYGVVDSSVETIYAPVDIKLFESRSKNTLRHDVFTDASPLRVGLIANWNPVKGIEYFINAIAEFREMSRIPLEIVFAGQKLSTHEKYSNYLSDLLNRLDLDHIVHDYGFVTSVAEVLDNIDVLVLSSISEACPMVVVEAMAAGRPVVATDVGGVREILKPGSPDAAGIVVPPRDATKIAASVLEIANSPELATKLGDNGRRIAKDRFSLEVCVQKHLKLYETIYNV